MPVMTGLAPAMIQMPKVMRVAGQTRAVPIEIAPLLCVMLAALRMATEAVAL